MSTIKTKSLSDMLAPILRSIEATELPSLLFLLERKAAEMYFKWSDSTDDSIEKACLVRCGDIEREISEFFAGYSESTILNSKMILEKHPLLFKDFDACFENLSLEEQYAQLAEAEIGGENALNKIADLMDGPNSDLCRFFARQERSNSEILKLLHERIAKQRALGDSLAM